MNILAVGIGGFFGAICRYLMNEHISISNDFPFATLLANWIGCFFLAYLLSTTTKSWHPRIKLAITTGFLGAFTTFSTFSLEVFQMISHGNSIFAIVYLVATIFGGLGFSLIGFLLAKGGRKG